MCLLLLIKKSLKAGSASATCVPQSPAWHTGLGWCLGRFLEKNWIFGIKACLGCTRYLLSEQRTSQCNVPEVQPIPVTQGAGEAIFYHMEEILRAQVSQWQTKSLARHNQEVENYFWGYHTKILLIESIKKGHNSISAFTYRFWVMFYSKRINF